MPVQTEWRFCHKCNAMFFDGFPTKGMCPAGGGHTAAGFVFKLPYDTPPTATDQDLWRFCHKCNVMFYDGFPAKGTCPGGGGHEAAGYMFVLPHDVPGVDGNFGTQRGWRFCHRCNAMFFDGFPNKGTCPSGGVHEPAGFEFVLEHTAAPSTSSAAINDRYNELGGAGSWLGAPTSSERPFSEGGRVSLFQNGSIYWWPDTGAIDVNKVGIRYKGLYCFSTTSGLGADEPYVVIATTPAPPAPGTNVKTDIYDDVDGGDSRPDDIVLFEGLPYGAFLQCGLWEHDAGDRDAVLGMMKDAADIAARKATDACEGQFGSDVAELCKDTWEDYLKDDVGGVLAQILGVADDKISAWGWNITPKQMVTAVRTPNREFWGITYRLESNLLSGDGADYKVYLDIVPA